MRQLNYPVPPQTRFQVFAATAALLIITALTPTTRAQNGNTPTEAASLFGDHMVLQQDMTVPVWGWAEPGAKITVEIAEQKVIGHADAQGRWRIDLAPMKAGGPMVMTILSYGRELRFTDVLIGEVWLCAGQSNMEMELSQVDDAASEIASANLPKIRLFHCARQKDHAPMDKAQGRWVVCDPKEVKDFSAVGFLFGRELQQKLGGVPMGLIESAWGATMVQGWTSEEMLKSDPENQPLLARYESSVKDYPQDLANYDEAVKKWEAAVKEARAQRVRAPYKPEKPEGPDSRNAPAVLFNGMVNPLVPYTLRGIIWYQGESDDATGYDYRRRFTEMIQDWRKHWGQEHLPFLFVQLPNYGESQTNPNERGEWSWAEMRESQAQALKLSHTAQAVTIDLGQGWQIHPTNKQPVAHRLTLAALAMVYGKDVPYQGPTYQKMQVQDGKVRLWFDHTEGGLHIKGDKLTGFALAGADRKFEWAQARIEGDTVAVWSDQVKSPVAVRFGWGNNPHCNLYNGADLPATTFRTDDWPTVTQGKQ